ncbi:helix-turn-helix transcriptional regulator [Novosphingobium sp. BW1]|nr:AraC family transcriptional regulator [Novosphingobium sp. BW1]TYC85428.1 helix-turn-helix transcriptional regulator [Novosphingobium sp. BW1]
MMQKKAPAFDPLIVPEFGTTPTGQPLSYNRAPSRDVAPWIGRIYISKVDLPEGYTLKCSQFNDIACLRLQLAGRWAAKTANGWEEAERSACLFGPQTHPMPIRVSGSFTNIGVAIRPGASTALKGVPLGEIVNRLVRTGDLGLPEDELLARFAPEGTPEDWARALEDLFRERVEETGGAVPDPISVQFEQLAYRTPSMTVAQAARECGVDRRRLERVILRDYGLPPKQVLRRARALDMASHLRGVGDRSEAEAIMLRYYDESHLIHEFADLFGVSPSQFAATAQPLLTLSLEARQARRLEDLKRIAPGDARPWQKPPA